MKFRFSSSSKCTLGRKAPVAVAEVVARLALRDLLGLKVR
jgi:hypothetical protein